LYNAGLSLLNAVCVRFAFQTTSGQMQRMKRNVKGKKMQEKEALHAFLGKIIVSPIL